MGTSNKRGWVEDDDRSISPPKATQARMNSQHSDVSRSRELEHPHLLPKPPLRARRKLNTFNVENRDTRIGNLVATNFAPNEYEHESLSKDPSDDQIRLLILHHGKPEDKIHCSFRILSLSEAEDKYEALSYYWGTEGDNHEIRIRTVAKSEPGLKGLRKLTKQVRPQKYYIRPRLLGALTQLRDRDDDICLWVDALCINQEDEVEKTQQVQKMARIYSTALRVIIWLGAGNEKCEEGLDFVKEILDLKNFDAKVKDEKSPPKWAALVELMGQDWFSRRWVIQELALARDATIHYNDKHINWKDFADATAIFATRFDDIKRLFLYHREFDHNAEYLGDLQALGANTMVEVTANHFRVSPGAPDGLERLSSLEALVSRLLKFEASDPKDTIYALLSIYKKQNSFDEVLVPNYEKSIIEVYRDFTQYCVSTSRSIDIICRHWAPAGVSKSATFQHLRIVRKKHKNNNKSRVNAKMPSWVPLLTDSPFGAPRQVPPGRVNGDSLVGLPDRKCYNACGGIFKKPHFEGDATEPHAVSFPQGDRPATLLEHDSSVGQIKEEAGYINTGIPGATDDSVVGSPKSSSSSSSGQSAPSTISEPLKDQTPKLPPVNVFFMSVTGIHLDTVTEVSARIPPGLLTQECLEMGGWKGRDGGQDGIPDELWQTLVAGRGPQGGQPQTFYNRACWDCFCLANPSGDINMASLIADPKTPSILKDFLKRVQSIVWNRLFFRSDRKKLFGLGPKGTKVNDLICILFGCSVPVILRAQLDPHSLQTMHYEVVGECYIYGMMDGEAVAKMDHRTDPMNFKLG